MFVCSEQNPEFIKSGSIVCLLWSRIREPVVAILVGTHAPFQTRYCRSPTFDRDTSDRVCISSELWSPYLHRGAHPLAVDTSIAIYGNLLPMNVS